MSSLGESGLRTATTALVLTVPPFFGATAGERVVVSAKVTVSSCIYHVAEHYVRNRRRSLDSYSDAELAALYAPTAEEDRELAALGLSAWVEGLDKADRR